MIIDSHCHLNYQPLITNIKKVISRAQKVGVKYFLTICTTDENFKDVLNLTSKFDNIFGTYGNHPHETKNHINLDIDHIKKKSSTNNKIIGIGETGLDFFYNHSDQNVQVNNFIKHIRVSQSTSKTLIVHSRSAEDKTFDILNSEFKNNKFKILMHCFTGSKKFAHKLLDIGCYFSASGIITFKKNTELTEVFKSIPIDRILVETDSPYLSPEPLRGKSNEPSHIIHTLNYMAKIKQETFDQMSSITSHNFFNLFPSVEKK